MKPNVRDDFPFLERRLNGKPIAYFDNAGTTQKPRHVIDILTRRYAAGIANVSRAVNFLGDEVTSEFEESRNRIASFIGAQASEVVLTPGTTYGINLVCASLHSRLGRKPRILTTTLEHHSNLLPWTESCDVTYIPWDASTGVISLDALESLLSTKQIDLIAIARASNVLGSLQPVGEISELARRSGAEVLIDASQSIAHETTDVRKLGCQYLVFSGHKVYGPGGTGVLWIDYDRIEAMPIVSFGGSMVKEVHSTHFIPNDIPHRFEAGTPNIEGVLGLAAALDYLVSLGFDAISSHERTTTDYARARLATVRGVDIIAPPIGTASAPLVVFQSRFLESSALAKVLGNQANVVVRSGFHCAQPAHDELGVGPTVRASFALYNTQEEVDSMIAVLTELSELVD